MSVSTEIPLIDLPPSLMRPDLERRAYTGRRFLDLTGRKFERCEVIGLVGFLSVYATWLCKCKCGNLFIARSNHVAHRPAGCGCGNKSHGLSGTYWNSTYNGMMQRCYNPNNAQFGNYGGRGIKVCKRWRDSIENFAADMGERPSPQHSIDRINNDGDYRKSNCRWATQLQQVRNSRGIRWVEINGERLPLSAWASKIGLTRERLRQRADICAELGADISEAVTTPAGESMPCIIKDAENRRLAKDSIRRSTMEWLDGSVHHLTAGDADNRAIGMFDPFFRRLCAERGLKARVRRLGDHILLQAVPSPDAHIRDKTA